VAGIYTPKKGTYAGVSFKSYRAYKDKLAQDKGYKSYYYQGKAVGKRGEAELIKERQRGNQKVFIHRMKYASVGQAFDFIRAHSQKDSFSIVVLVEKFSSEYSGRASSKSGWITLTYARKARTYTEKYEKDTQLELFDIAQDGAINDVHVWQIVE